VKRGVYYVAYGDNARREAQQSILSLRRATDLPVAVVSDKPLGVEDVFVEREDERWDPGAREAKLKMLYYSPFEQTLYLDADTRPRVNVMSGFEALDDGWDMVLCPSKNQEGKDWLWHLDPDARMQVWGWYGFEAVVFQAGVMWVANNDRTTILFDAWRMIWRSYKMKMDQGALMMAMTVDPVKLWLFGHPWNGGALIAHHFGQARR